MTKLRPKNADTIHPFIRGLLDKLPPAGNEWTLDERMNWFEAAAAIFNLMYKGKGKIRIGAASNEPK